MNAFIQLTGINFRKELENEYRAEEHRRTVAAITSEGSNVVRLDDLERPVVATPEVVPAAPLPEEVTFPITINVTSIREFYARRNDKPGTRIVFQNGAAQLVTDSYDDIANKIRNVLGSSGC